MEEVLGRRLVVVTGKGGVGKTTVAAALGLAAARAGKRTMVCEVSEQERITQAFERRHASCDGKSEATWPSGPTPSTTRSSRGGVPAMSMRSSVAA